MYDRGVCPPLGFRRREAINRATSGQQHLPPFVARSMSGNVGVRHSQGASSSRHENSCLRAPPLPFPSRRAPGGSKRCTEVSHPGDARQKRKRKGEVIKQGEKNAPWKGLPTPAECRLTLPSFLDFLFCFFSIFFPTRVRVGADRWPARRPNPDTAEPDPCRSCQRRTPPLVDLSPCVRGVLRDVLAKEARSFFFLFFCRIVALTTHILVSFSCFPVRRYPSDDAQRRGIPTTV